MHYSCSTVAAAAGQLSNRQLGDLVYCLAEINHVRADVAFYVKRALQQQKLHHDQLLAGYPAPAGQLGPPVDTWVEAAVQLPETSFAPDPALPAAGLWGTDWPPEGVDAEAVSKRILAGSGGVGGALAGKHARCCERAP